ncbi:MAG: hypothetical protein PHF80_04100, partial [Methanothrix sp.]|nr:hypothetical protein [Methanothrix sp.]
MQMANVSLKASAKESPPIARAVGSLLPAHCSLCLLYRPSVNYRALKDAACGCAKNRATIGRLTAALALIFRAAMLSAGREKPQQVQQNSSLAGRLDFEI